MKQPKFQPSSLRFLSTLVLFQPRRSLKVYGGEDGAYLPNGTLRKGPKIMRFGLLGFVAVLIPGLALGAWIGREFAGFLEETEIFVPED